MGCFLTHQWRAKAITFFVVGLLWLVLAGQQNFEVKLKVPLEITNLPNQIEMVEPRNPMVEITVRGLRKDASTLGKGNVTAEIDLSHVFPGRRYFPITKNLINLPHSRVQLVDIEPSEVMFEFQKKPELERKTEP
ncbi:MAG TPA: hypothetical protein HPP59_06920 [Deltaproteobacteria bacterium]|nr:hypothetical protein [Deltaproteobacteria bacterium]